LNLSHAVCLPRDELLQNPDFERAQLMRVSHTS